MSRQASQIPLLQQTPEILAIVVHIKHMLFDIQYRWH